MQSVVSKWKPQTVGIAAALRPPSQLAVHAPCSALGHAELREGDPATSSVVSHRVAVSATALHVLLEGLVRLHDALDVVHAEDALLGNRDRLAGLDGVLDLCSVSVRCL